MSIVSTNIMVQLTHKNYRENIRQAKIFVRLELNRENTCKSLVVQISMDVRAQQPIGDLRIIVICVRVDL